MKHFSRATFQNTTVLEVNFAIFSLKYGQADVDDCLRLEWSCENGGQAVDTGKSCECQCAGGYTGEHCQTGSLCSLQILDKYSLWKLLRNARL